MLSVRACGRAGTVPVRAPGGAGCVAPGPGPCRVMLPVADAAIVQIVSISCPAARLKKYVGAILCCSALSATYRPPSAVCAMRFFDYIPASRRANLWNYRYSGTDKSLLSKHLLGPYWTWLVSLFPTWIAPNTITLSGLALVAVNLLTVFWHDASLQAGTLAQQAKIVSLPQAISEHASRGGVPPVRPLWSNYGVPDSVIVAEPVDGWSIASLLSGKGGAVPLPNWLYLT